MRITPRSLEGYHIGESTRKTQERQERRFRMEMDPRLCKSALKQVEAGLVTPPRPLLIPVSGGRDSVLITLMAHNQFGSDNNRVHYVFEGSTASLEEKQVIDVLRREYNIPIDDITLDSDDVTAIDDNTGWDKVTEIHARRSDLFYQIGEDENRPIVDSTNLTELLLGLTTPGEHFGDQPGQYANQPILFLQGSEIRQLLAQVNVPRTVHNQLPFTSETGGRKEAVLGASYDIIDALLWLKLHSSDLPGICKALNVDLAWAKELFDKRVVSHVFAEYYEKLIREGFETISESVPDELQETLRDDRFQRLVRNNIPLSGLNLDKKPSVERFYDGLR